MASTATLYHDAAKTGTSTTLMLDAGSADPRYAFKRFTELSQPGLAFSITSATLSRAAASRSEEASLYLFTGNTAIDPNDLRRSVPNNMLNMRAPLPFLQDFHGDYLQMTLHPSPGVAASMEINDLAANGFDNRATSLMLVHRFRADKPETTVSAADTFTFGWNTTLRGIIPIVQFALGGGVAIMPIQDPVFTWVAYPPSIPNLPSNQVYMVVSQWCVFHAWGIGINVWLSFYVRLARDAGGKLQVNLVDLDRYVWPGTGQGDMYRAIDGAKAGILSALSNVSGGILGNISNLRCDDVYLLPGKQLNATSPQDAVTRSDALRDVTIVLENQH